MEYKESLIQFCLAMIYDLTLATRMIGDRGEGKGSFRKQICLIGRFVDGFAVYRRPDHFGYL